MSDSAAGLLQAGALLAALALAYRPLGGYLAHVFSSDHDLRVERPVYHAIGIDPRADQSGQTVGSSLIGQSLEGNSGYFQSRPSAAGDGYDPTATSASNLALDNPVLVDLVREFTQARTLGFLGEPRVNVLELNLALDEQTD